MSIEIVFETHALSEDNERGTATGWLPGRLCDRGRVNAADMGRRRRDDGIAAVFSSDLRRAAETAQLAFGDTQHSDPVRLAAARVRLRRAQRYARGRDRGRSARLLRSPVPRR